MRQWRLLLEDYDYEFKYTPGKENIIADMISRYPMQQNEINAIQDMIMSMEEEINFPLTFLNIEKAQKEELKSGKTYSGFLQKMIEGKTIWTNQQNKIILPTSLLNNTIRWYHFCLKHPGIHQTYKTISMHFWHENLIDHIDKFIKKCEGCSRGKRTYPKYGKIPPAVDTVYLPWEVIQVDLFGPWKFNDLTGKEKVIHALSIIDPATKWIELQLLKKY